jgi:hypothetical protein
VVLSVESQWAGAANAAQGKMMHMERTISRAAIFLIIFIMYLRSNL